MKALANQGLSWPVTYEATSSRRCSVPRFMGKAGSACSDPELDRKNLGATGICFVGLSLSGIAYRARGWATTPKTGS